MFSPSAFKTGTQVPIVTTYFIHLSSLVHFSLVSFSLDIDFTWISLSHESGSYTEFVVDFDSFSWFFVFHYTDVVSQRDFAFLPK